MPMPGFNWRQRLRCAQRFWPCAMHCGTAIWSDWCRFASPPTVSRCLRHNILRIDHVQTFHRSPRRGVRRRREPDSNHRSLSYDQYPNGLLDVGGEIPRYTDSPLEEAGLELFVPLGISASPSWWRRARKPHGAPQGSFSVAGPIVRIHLPPPGSLLRT